ncbi:MAG: glucokinase [Rubrivivax sp.]|nr:glucokinase [Rubrivivax sp.]
MSADRLLADIGGTNARFAWQPGPGRPIEQRITLPCAEYASLAEAVHHYLRIIGREPPTQCAIAIATPVLGDEVRMTNHHWSFSTRELQGRFGFGTIKVLNDFTALALGLPGLDAAQLRRIGGGAADVGQAVALIGPGTGLGVGGLLPVRATDGTVGHVPVQGEGGHVTLAARSAREQAVLAEIGRRWGHVSAERVLSGPGLMNLHRALARLAHPTAPEPEFEAAEITAAALAGDPLCAQVLQLFSSFLGNVAGNLALTLGARGGVYLGGGIVPRLHGWLERSDFRAAFEDKGRFASYLAPIPVWLIASTHSPALEGAARALDTDLR